MLVLSTLNSLLSQVLQPPDLHTAILLTPAGQLVSFASNPSRSKDEIRILVGLSGEVWQETREQRYGAVDSELGRVVVLPVDEPAEELPQPLPEDHQPLMLLTLNSTDEISWEELKSKGKVLASHLAKPLSKYREHLAVVRPIPPATSSSVTSPAPARSR